ncbi:MAG: metal ABC transporter ATP-binding protein [Propionibacteriaceae bacterium]|nr:metal ABC transporter ATP-binding protein [Propionibacteriaceae bacterium]
MQARGLTVAYQQHVALTDADLDVPAGHIVALLGPNGAGKSTLLKASVGLLRALRGEVTFFGSRLAEVRQQVGYMSQAAEVDWDFPTTVRDVVMMGRYGRRGWFRRPTATDRQAVMAALEAVGIPDLAPRQISQLSGGQKQRTFMARILAQDPDLFLLDEPLAGVDVASQDAIVGILKKLRSQGKTVVLVHHDLNSVPSLADDVVLLRDGRVVAAGPVAETFTQEVVLECYGFDGLRTEAET